MGLRVMCAGGIAWMLVAMTPIDGAGFDLTGTWTGRVSCRGVLEGRKHAISRTSSTLLINHGAALEVSADGIFYNGSEIADPFRPTRGEAVLIRCGTDPTIGTQFGGEFARLKVATKPEKGTGTLKGTALRTDVVLADTVYTCRWSYKRISTAAPQIDGCP